MAQNRTRTRQIVLRFTDKEYEKVTKQMALANKKSRSDFILDCIDKKPTLDMTVLRETLVELKRQGNNLNQIARSVNQGVRVSDEVCSLLNECHATYKQIIDFVENLDITHI
jgi:uncharacterized protein (DUF1778 family)